MVRYLLSDEKQFFVRDAVFVRMMLQARACLDLIYPGVDEKELVKIHGTFIEYADCCIDYLIALRKEIQIAEEHLFHNEDLMDEIEKRRHQLLWVRGQFDTLIGRGMVKQISYLRQLTGRFITDWRKTSVTLRWDKRPQG